MGYPCPILDDYPTHKNVPRTAAKQCYKLTDKELSLIRSSKKRHGYFRSTMQLYSRASVVRLACEKYGCTKKNLAEVLKQDRPPIVKQLIERGGGKPAAPAKKKTKSAPVRAASPIVIDSDDEPAAAANNPDDSEVSD